LSLPRIILYSSAFLLGAIGVVGLVKKMSKKEAPSSDLSAKILSKQPPHTLPDKPKLEVAASQPLPLPSAPPGPLSPSASKALDDFPEMDRVYQLFTTGPSKLPIVETISYTSQVPWLKGRPAWVADYATYYTTSRHFIARSLNKKPDYFSQKVMTGSTFTVFRKDKRLEFHLVVDVTRAKMGFYYVDLDTNERVLLKTYKVGLGKLDPSKASGSLTPLGKYKLGNKVDFFKPDQRTDMVRIFGTRWLPFEGEGQAVKGYGLHGAPWKADPKTGALVEEKEWIGRYESNGSVCLAQEDIEELYAIVITKPTFIEIVKDFREAKLPGAEVAAPKR